MDTKHPLHREALEYVVLHPASSHQLARELGLSQSWVTKFRRGEIENPGIMTLQRILEHKNKSKEDVAA